MRALSVVVAVVMASAAQAQMTVDQAVESAVKNAFQVRDAKVGVQRADEIFRSAKGRLGPRLELQGSYARITQSAPITTFPDAFPSITENKQVQLVLAQSVDISGLAKNALNATRHQRDAALFGLDVQVNLLKKQVRDDYYLVLKWTEYVQVQKEEVAAAEERLAKAQIRYEEEQIPKFDVLRLETDLMQSEHTLVETESTLELAKQQFNHSLGRPIETPVVLADVEDLPDSDLPADRLTVLALRSRPEVKQQDSSIKSLRELREVETGGMKPSMQVTGSLTQTLGASTGQRESQFIAAANITLPLYDSGATKSSVAAADRDIDRAIVGFDQIQLGIALEIRSSLTRLTDLKKKISVAEVGQDLAAESLRLAQLRFDEGIGLLIDVTTAQTTLTGARAAVVGARYDYLAAYSSLQMAAANDNLIEALQKMESEIENKEVKS